MHLGRTPAGEVPQPGDANSERATKLELIERLADDLAHEIKNPLHSMVINLEVLKRRIVRPGGSGTDELLRYVGVLAGELDRVNRRVELLFRLVRPDRGGEPTTLEEVLGDLLELLELEQKRRKVSVRYEPSSIPVRGHLPAEASRQLVLGLLFGMVEVVPSGGGMLIRTEVDPHWSRLRIEGAAPDSDASVDFSSLHEDLLARLGVVRRLTDRLGGRLEVGPAEASNGTDPIVSVELSFPLTMSGS